MATLILKAGAARVSVLACGGAEWIAAYLTASQARPAGVSGPARAPLASCPAARHLAGPLLADELPPDRVVAHAALAAGAARIAERLATSPGGGPVIGCAPRDSYDEGHREEEAAYGVSVHVPLVGSGRLWASRLQRSV